MNDEVVIERLVPGGAGFSRGTDGRPIFVRGALPGDRILLGQVHDRRSFLEASDFRLIAPGPDRAPVPCVDQERCGGCALMPLTLDAQRRAKLGLLQEALARTGRFRPGDLPEPTLRSAGPALGYRLRVKLQHQRGKLGFFAAASHDLVDVQRCQVASPESWRLVEAARAVFASAFERAPARLEAIESVEVRSLPGRVLSGQSERDSFFVTTTGASHEVTRLEALLEPLARHGRVIFSGGRKSQPNDQSEQRLDVAEGVHVRAPVGGFCQVNPHVNRALVSDVLETARSSGARTFLDLYCGAGNFALPLGKAGLSGVGVELDAGAIAAAERAARDLGLGGLQFQVGDVAKRARLLAGQAARYDIVIVDPPRAGAKDTVPQLARLTRRVLVMVSCDPVTLARDLRQLVEMGARVERLDAWDMFPQTHHVESCAVLSFPSNGG